jgi:sulfate permease, SulP family
LFNLQNYKNSNIKNDVLSGTVVAVALVPEAIAFAFIAGVSPLVGLYAAFILGLITAILGGKPGMISGATGAVAVVFVGLGLKVNELYADAGLSSAAMSEMILQYILVASILAGMIQITIGALKMGKFIRLVPQPAMYGFVNGLAIVIASSQFKFFEGESWIMYVLVVVTMLIMQYMPRFTKVVPAGLAAIIAITVVVYYGGLNTKTVGDLADISGVLPSLHMPTMPWTTETFMLVLPYAVLVALVGLIESLLTLSVLDEMGGERGHGNKECIAQGVGNVTCGSFGAMAGCAMIGQSIINFSSGGLGRLSGITAALLLISFVVLISDLISVIPVAVLVGIMFMVSIGTFEWSSLNRLKKMPKSDAFVVVAVTIITIIFDLAVAVIFGVIISALVFAWKHAKIHAFMSKEEDGTTLYSLEGPLFFGSVTSFNEQFDIANDSDRVVIDFKGSRVLDISGVEAVDGITKKYREAGKEIHLRHLSADCRSILKEAGEYCDFQEDDPTYKVAYNY